MCSPIHNYNQAWESIFPKKLLLGVVMKIKKILLIGICLLVATLGLTAASAAEVNNNTKAKKYFQP